MQDPRYQVLYNYAPIQQKQAHESGLIPKL